MSKPPIRAELYWKELTCNERSLLHAMLELSGGTGDFIWPSIERLAAYTKLCTRTVQRLIHGYVDRRGRRRKGLLERGILSELAPSSRAKHNTATYRLNVAALHDDRGMERYPRPWLQPTIQGVLRRPVNGEPIPTPPGDTVSPGRVTQCQNPGDTVSPYSKAFDSRTIDSKPPIPVFSSKLAERNERERRDGLTEAARRGLRDYAKHPLEPWERSA